jgi:hypothetical protein
MDQPHEHFRAYLDDGPRAGETVSIAPAEDGSVPETLVLDDSGALEAVGGTPERSGDADDATTTYRLAQPDMDNGLWVYRSAPADGENTRADHSGN